MRGLSHAVAIAVVLFTGSGATAEHFVVETDVPIVGDDAELMTSLRLVKLDAFEHEGRSYIVLDARDASVIEAYFAASQIVPVEMKVSRADWPSLPFFGASRQQSMAMLAETPCEFCAAR